MAMPASVHFLTVTSAENARGRVVFSDSRHPSIMVADFISLRMLPKSIIKTGRALITRPTHSAVLVVEEGLCMLHLDSIVREANESCFRQSHTAADKKETLLSPVAPVPLSMAVPAELTASEEHRPDGTC
jgi:hypothetical protein